MADPDQIELIYAQVGDRIAELRRQRGLTQDALGALMHVRGNYAQVPPPPSRARRRKRP